MYSKIFKQIFSSSIMEEDALVRYTWICLLILADKDGVIDMTLPSIARTINIDLAVVTKSIELFMQADPNSRTKDNSGRKLEKIRDTFGWKILNFAYYNNLRNEDERRERNKEAAYRYRRKLASSSVIARHNKSSASAHTDTYTDTDTDTNKKQTHTPAPSAPDLVCVFNTLWEKYPNKDGRKEALRHFVATVKTEQDVKDITAALENYVKSDKVLKGFIKSGSTWFNNWKDWVTYPISQPQKKLTPEEFVRNLHMQSGGKNG